MHRTNRQAAALVPVAMTGCPAGYQRVRTGVRAALMRINIWIVLVVLIALFAGTRLLRYHKDTQRICADDPSAPVCGR
jgi:hypothetical protein